MYSAATGLNGVITRRPQYDFNSVFLKFNQTDLALKLHTACTLLLFVQLTSFKIRFSWLRLYFLPNRVVLLQELPLLLIIHHIARRSLYDEACPPVTTVSWVHQTTWLRNCCYVKNMVSATGVNLNILRWMFESRLISADTHPGLHTDKWKVIFL